MGLGVVWRFMVRGFWRVINLEVLALKSFGAIRMLVYCNGIYRLVEINGFGTGFFTTSAKVEYLEGTRGLKSNEDDPWWSLLVFMKLVALVDLSGRPSRWNLEDNIFHLLYVLFQNQNRIIKFVIWKIYVSNQILNIFC